MTASMALWQLQQAIYAKLTADTSLMSLVSGVYDFVPQASSASYIVLRPSEIEPTLHYQSTDYQGTFTILLFDQRRSREPLVEITDRVQTLLHRANLILEDFTLLSLTLSRQSIRRESDGITSRGESSYRFRLITEAAYV